DIVALIDSQRDIALKMDVERFVRLVSFRPGAITFEPVGGAPSNLSQRLVARLKEWTGQPWLVVAETGGRAGTLRGSEEGEKAALRRESEDDPFVKSVMEAFPGAEITEIRHIPTPEAEPAPVEDDEEDDA